MAQTMALRRYFAFCLFGLLLAATRPVAGGAEIDQLRVATYNLRNYLTMDRLVDGQFRRDYPKPEDEKAVVRLSIRETDPDVLAVQEIGSLAMLKELQADLSREGLTYSGCFVLEANDDTRRLGALWKSEVELVPVGHTDLDFPLFEDRRLVKRGMLELRIDNAAGGPLSLFVLHLKSRYTDDPRDPKSGKRRAREARAARNRILELYPDPRSARFLALGDLNDQRHSSPVRRFLVRGDLEISRLLDCRDEQGLIWTHFYKKGGEYSLIDYILVSPGLQSASDISGGIYSGETYYTGSDHRLVWADLDLKNR